MSLNIGTLTLPIIGIESICLTILQGDQIYCLTSAACLAPYFNQSESSSERVSKIFNQSDDTSEKLTKIIHDGLLSAEVSDIRGLLNFDEIQPRQTLNDITSRFKETLKSNITSCKNTGLLSEEETNKELCLNKVVQFNIVKSVLTEISSCNAEVVISKRDTTGKNVLNKINDIDPEEPQNNSEQVVRINLARSQSPDLHLKSAPLRELKLQSANTPAEGDGQMTEDDILVKPQKNAGQKLGLNLARAQSPDLYFESAPLRDSNLESANTPEDRQMTRDGIVVNPCFVNKIPEVLQTLRRIFKSQDFKINYCDKIGNEMFFELASTIIIFGTNTSEDNLPPLLQSLQSCLAPLVLGSPLLVVSSPFSIPSLRYSWSAGILSSSVSLSPVFLTDASLAPGAQGSLVFSSDGRLTGIVVCSLFRNQSEAVSFSLGVSLLSMVQGLVAPAPPKSNISIRTESTGSDISRQIVLVRCGVSWGSGVILDAKAGIIITCAHVVKAKEDVEIRFLDQTYSASIIFESADDSAFDLALLASHCQLQHGLSAELNPLEPRLGSGVTCAGYPVFNEHALTPLSVTLSSGIISKLHKTPDFLDTSKIVHSSGIISKLHRVPNLQDTSKTAHSGGIISQLHRTPNFLDTSKTAHSSGIIFMLHRTRDFLEPSNTTLSSGDSRKLCPQLVMLQSSCTVHAGVSGGGLLDSEGKLVGVMVCNVKSSWGDATGIHPSLNMAVPICAIHAILAEYLRTKDPAVLSELNISNADVKRIWNLQPIRSKL